MAAGVDQTTGKEGNLWGDSDRYDACYGGFTVTNGLIRVSGFFQRSHVCRFFRRMYLMRLRSLAALLAIALFASPVAAQEQRGSIEGVVRDASGAVIPGATVEARSAGSGVLSTTTDANGSFRFPSVLPGVYEVSATLSGFKPAKTTNVEVRL